MGRISERLKHDTQALIDGYKPAIISERGKSYEDLKKRYPYICPFVSAEPDSLIFFQTAEHKDLYLERMRNVEEGSPQFEYILGTTLGFPERSAKWFASIVQKKQELGYLPDEKQLYGVGVYWAGFSFSSNVEFVDQEIEWLWNTYDHPKAIENPLFLYARGQGFTEIQYGDQGLVKQVQESVLKYRKIPIASR